MAAQIGLSASLEELRKYRGIAFDAAVVDSCLDLIENQTIQFSDTPAVWSPTATR